MTTTPDGSPSGVVFDLGNVLVRWDPAAASAVGLGAEVSGLPLDRLLFVDDSPTNVAAAAAVGMDAIVFTGAADLRAALRRRCLPVAPAEPEVF